MQVFHERHRQLLLLSIFGGVYLPSLTRIIPWKPVRNFLKGYAVFPATGFLLLAIFALKHSLFDADDLITRIMSFNNFNDDILACGQILLINMQRNEAQALYDLWDVYFTGDGHDDTRKKLLDNVKKPNKKPIIACVTLISVMSISWCIDQFDNEDYDFSVPMGIPFQNQKPEFLFWAVIVFILFLVYGPMLLTVDLLVMEPLIWLTAEYIRLKNSLREILNTIRVTEEGEIIRNVDGFERIVQNRSELEDDFKIIEKKINDWIIEHQKLLVFHRKMISVIHRPLFIHLLSIATTMCLFSVIFALQVFSLVDVCLSSLVYLPKFWLFYMIITYGDQVEAQSEGVFDYAFATSWEIYPKHIQKNLLIIVMRTRCASTVNILKLFPLKSKTFLQIVQTAYSFYSFLRFLTNKDN